MSVFDVARNTLFSDRNLAVDIVYAPFGLPPIACRAIRQQPEVDTDLGSSNRVKQSTTTFDIRTSEIAAAAEGDTILFGNVSYRVMTGSVRDPIRGIIRVEAAPT